MDLTYFSELNEAEVIALAIVGALVLFAGYKIKKIGFFIVWFLLGFRLVQYLLPTLGEAVPQIVGNELWQNLLPLAGGLLLGLMGFTVEKICVGGIVFGITLAITAQYFGTEMQTMLIGGVVGVVLAGVSTMLMKPAIVLATAAAGAYALVICIFHWANGLDPTTLYMPLLVGITAVGAGVQFATTRRE